MHEQICMFPILVYILFFLLFSEPKFSRRQIVPEDFCVIVDAITAEEQPEIDVKIELTVNGETCEAQYKDVVKDHAKHI